MKRISTGNDGIASTDILKKMKKDPGGLFSIDRNSALLIHYRATIIFVVFVLGIVICVVSISVFLLRKQDGRINHLEAINVGLFDLE